MIDLCPPLYKFGIGELHGNGNGGIIGYLRGNGDEGCGITAGTGVTHTVLP